MMIKGSIISGEIVGKIVIVNQLNREHILEPCLRVTFCENFHSQIENVRFDSKCKTDRFEKADQVEVVEMKLVKELDKVLELMLMESVELTFEDN